MSDGLENVFGCLMALLLTALGIGLNIVFWVWFIRLVQR